MRTLLLFGVRPTAWLLMLAALLWLAASWWPQAPAGGWVTQRPAALFLLGVGAFLMWLQTPRVLRRPPRGFELSSFKHSTLVGDSGPDTLPVGPPTSAFADGDVADVQGTAYVAPNVGPGAPKKPSRWRAGVLRAIEWQRFEAMCTALFKQDGYVAKLRSDETLVGTQMWLYAPTETTKPVRIVLCKHLSDGPIATTTVDGFRQVLQQAGVASGAIVTAGSFSDDAKQFARRNHIAPVDSVNLLTVILRRSEAQQQELLAVATQGEYWRPSCPVCSAKMARISGLDGTWGCTGVPTCAGTVNWVPEVV